MQADATCRRSWGAFRSRSTTIFDGHPYDGKQIPRCPSSTAPSEVIVELVGSSEFVEVSEELGRQYPRSSRTRSGQTDPVRLPPQHRRIVGDQPSPTARLPDPRLSRWRSGDRRSRHGRGHDLPLLRAWSTSPTATGTYLAFAFFEFRETGDDASTVRHLPHSAAAQATVVTALLVFVIFGALLTW